MKLFFSVGTRRAAQAEVVLDSVGKDYEITILPMRMTNLESKVHKSATVTLVAFSSISTMFSNSISYDISIIYCVTK